MGMNYEVRKYCASQSNLERIEWTDDKSKRCEEDLGSSGNICSDIFKWLTKEQVNVFLQTMHQV